MPNKWANGNKSKIYIFLIFKGAYKQQIIIFVYN